MTYHSDGEQVPLIAIRTWTVEMKNIESLALALGPEQPVYSIGPPDFDTLEAFPGNTSEWVDFLRPRIEALGYHGDVLLMGWSFGGVMALELAKSLASEGRSVRRVIMIDTRLPAQPKRPKTTPGVKMPIRVRGVANTLLEYSYIESRPERLRLLAFRFNPVRLVREDRERQRKRAEKLELARNSGSGSVVTRFDVPMTFLKRTIHVSYLKYIARPTDIAVTLLRTEESLGRSGNDPSLGWAPFFLGRFVMDAIDGTHETLFEESYIHALARQVETALADTWAQQEKSPSLGEAQLPVSPGEAVAKLA